jgi:hypothetical protein
LFDSFRSRQANVIDLLTALNSQRSEVDEEDVLLRVEDEAIAK